MKQERNKLDRFAKGEIVLHTPTQEIYDKLMQWRESKGITMLDGKNHPRINYWPFGGSTTVVVNEKLGALEGIAVSKSKLFNERKYETLSLADFGEPKEELTPESKQPDRFKVEIFFHENKTGAWLINNGKVVKVASAKCHPDDKFSMAVGSQLALARLFEKKQKKEVSNNPIDKFVKFLLAFGEHIAEQKSKQQVKEVTRPAKVGEWIKVVKTVEPDGYEIGDIIKVIEGYDPDSDIVICEGDQYLYNSEYVVLEGYQDVQ